MGDVLTKPVFAKLRKWAEEWESVAAQVTSPVQQTPVQPQPIVVQQAAPFQLDEGLSHHETPLERPVNPDLLTPNVSDQPASSRSPEKPVNPDLLKPYTSDQPSSSRPPEKPVNPDLLKPYMSDQPSSSRPLEKPVNPDLLAPNVSDQPSSSRSPEKPVNPDLLAPNVSDQPSSSRSSEKPVNPDLLKPYMSDQPSSSRSSEKPVNPDLLTPNVSDQPASSRSPEKPVTPDLLTPNVSDQPASSGSPEKPVNPDLLKPYMSDQPSSWRPPEKPINPDLLTPNVSDQPASSRPPEKPVNPDLLKPYTSDQPASSRPPEKPVTPDLLTPTVSDQLSPPKPTGDGSPQPTGAHDTAVGGPQNNAVVQDAEPKRPRGPARDLRADETPTGLTGRALGRKFVGEDTGGGWQQGRTKDGKPIQTDYFDEQRKQASKVDFDPSGEVSSNATPLPDGQVGFVADPQTGDIHQFTAKYNTTGPTALSTHHSSPLAGEHVAGAGNMQIEQGHIKKIDDQSGHYKPTADFTFQTVRLIDQKTMTESLRQQLKDTKSDTLEQGIAAAIQKQRETFFKKLEKEMEDKQLAIEESFVARGLSREQIVPLMEKAQVELKDAHDAAANKFRAIAAAVEAELRKGAGVSPLRDKSPVVAGRRGSTPMVGTEANRETEISLLGKGGMVSDEEFEQIRQLPEDQREAAFNKATALRQLAGPLGEEAYAKLAKKKGEVKQKMAALKVDSIADLKKALGQEAVDAIKDDETRIRDLSTKHGVQSFTLEHIKEGLEAVNARVGQATAAKVTAEQFLQTGGNEGQIRNKASLNRDIAASLKSWREALNKKAEADEEKPNLARAVEQDKLKKLNAALADLKVPLEQAQKEFDEQDKIFQQNRSDYYASEELKRRQSVLDEKKAQAAELQEKIRAVEDRMAELKKKITVARAAEQARLKDMQQVLSGLPDQKSAEALELKKLIAATDAKVLELSQGSKLF